MSGLIGSPPRSSWCRLLMQAGDMAKGDAEDIQRMQKALATSGLMDQHKKAVAEGRPRPTPVARSMLTQVHVHSVP